LRLPPLPALRIFEAAGRTGNFRLAAEELGLTPSAVSHSILALEEWLGVDLFERGSRGVSLTAAGRDYLSTVAAALGAISDGTRRLAHPQARDRITVSVAPTFASRWLLPRLARFFSTHPDVELTVDGAHRQVRFPLDGVDMAIRMGRDAPSSLDATRLFGEILMPVCAPGFLTAHARGGALDFSRVPLIHVLSVTEDWDAWREGAGLPAAEPRGALHVDTVHLASDAAVAGLGVAIGRRPLIDEDIRLGRLVPAADTAVEASTAYWLVMEERTRERGELRALADWIVAEAATYRAE
jgi:DNA-binding transcriptional LysR family regulator